MGQFIDAGGIKTHYHEGGDGPPLLFIHGSGPGVSAWANWRLIFPKISEHFHYYAPDVIGFGYTERPEGVQYSVDLWVNHMIDFIETLNCGPISIVGNSMGGALALHIAIRKPDLVKSLVLMGSVGVSFPITDELDKVWGYTPSFENMKELIRIFSYDSTVADNDDLVELRYQSSIQQGFQEAFAQMFPSPRQAHLDALALTDTQLKSIQSPILLVHGREDKVIPFKTSLKLMETLQYAELHVFSQCGHWTQIEKTEQFVQQVIGFLKSGK